MPETESEKLAKLAYIEDQTNQLLRFRFASFDLLTKEAHITLNWFFGLITASAGYAFKLADEQLWYLAIPLVLAAGMAAREAWKLIKGALLAKEVPSPGNTPKHLLPALADRNEYELRLDNLKDYTKKIDQLRQLNLEKSRAINRARKALLLIPIGTILLAAIFLCFANIYFLYSIFWEVVKFISTLL